MAFFKDIFQINTFSQNDRRDTSNIVRKGHTADFALLSFPKTRTESNAQSNTVNATEPSGTQEFSVLTAKISVPVEATTNVAKLLTTLVYGHESASDVLHVVSEEKTEDPSISTDSLVELSSTESGNENVTQRIRYRAEERREGINPNHKNEDAVKSAAGYHVIAPDSKSGLDAVERRCQMIHESEFLGGDMKNTHLVNGLDNALVQKVRNENYYKEKEEEKLESLHLKHKDKGEWKEKFNLKQNWEDTFIRKFSKIAIQSKASSFCGDDSIFGDIGNYVFTLEKRGKTKQDKNAGSEGEKSYFAKPNMGDGKRKKNQKERVNEWNNILSSKKGENAKDRSKVEL
ncbi:protein Red [Nephila pilipes]|uniref:Protein Red n=1 Tax=Nephila pilipes TaxID=299642 RepID=A0A8X6NUN1_NEPPI|nr:protein Red [Nephila pilipes]